VDANTGKVTTRCAGTAHITAKASDGGSASKSVTVVVLPKKVGSLNAKKSPYYSKAIYVNWGYQSGVSGYQVSYSTDKNFKNAKTKTVTSTGVTISNLKKNKKYYVRVRAYVNNGSKKQYGAWSSVKSATAS
jgi:glucose/arabinose dehydrogenase